MPKFRVMLEGRNFLIPDAGNGESKHGFFANRFVEADDGKSAELLAVDQVRKKQSLRDMVRNIATDPPRIFLRGIEEVASFDDLPTLDQGLVWFPED